MADSFDPNQQRLEEIVAYLDGELSPEESAHVERRLASDESFRQQLQSIERAWNALDELPLAFVDDKFSRTTMELAVHEAAAEVREKTVSLPIQRRRRRLSNVFVAAAAAALGFLVVRLAWQSPERLLVADLPVVDNIDVYSQFEGPPFLRTLRTELGGQFNELTRDSNNVAQRIERMDSLDDVSRRDDWLQQLDDEQRTNLRAKFNRFRNLSPPEQQRLRALHEQIVEASDARELEQAMFAYHEWLGGLPPARQFELRNMPTEERIRTVREWLGEMRDDAILTLSEDELKRLLRQLRKARIQSLQSAAGPARPGEIQAVVLEALPERARAPFRELPPKEKSERFTTWMRQAEALAGEVSQEQLERFFAEELDAETRAELLSLPPSEMQQALRRAYGRPGRGFAGPWTWGRREGPQGFGGPGRGSRGGAGPDGRRPPRDGFGGPPDRERPGGPGGFGPPRDRPGRGGPRRPPPEEPWEEGPPQEPPRD
jgi:hypothetical protein